MSISTLLFVCGRNLCGKVERSFVFSIDDPSSSQSTRGPGGVGFSAPEARAALEQAARSGKAQAIVQLEITGAGIIGGVNELAADWAGKHALEKWFPDINEPTRTKIKQIIKNALEEKTPFSELIENIRNAGIFSGQRPRLMPTDLRTPECPYCQNALKKIPGAKTKCSQCGQFMYVRTRPEDSARVVVTEAEAHRIYEAWESKIRGGVHEPDDLATTIARTEVSQAQIGANFEAWKKSGFVKKAKWLAVGPDPCPICKANDGQASR